MEIPSAAPHPHSKYCLTKASQIISWIKAAMMPEMRAPKTPPTIVPMTTVITASLNLAFSLPTTIRPESQRAGETTIVDTIMLINNASKLKAKITAPFYEFLFNNLLIRLMVEEYDLSIQYGFHNPPF